MRSEPARSTRSALAATVLGGSILIGLTVATDPLQPSQRPTAAPVPVSVPMAVFAPLDPLLLIPRPTLGREGTTIWSGAPLSSALKPTDTRRFVAAEPVANVVAPVASSAVPEALRIADTVPLPPPRPAELAAASDSTTAPGTGRRSLRRTRTAAAAEPEGDNRSFFEKLFGVPPKPGPALAYAALDNAALATAPAPKLSPTPDDPTEGKTATYDIGARVVTLPNGDRLEAHSGLAGLLDDPRSVHVRMRGATPPGIYDLTEREELFHGVRALRLTPVGGSGAIYGRAGLLAHTFMLGPNGDSNGCVSFRDYDRFLQAFLRGDIRRLVVVAGNAPDRSPSGNRRLASNEHNN